MPAGRRVASGRPPRLDYLVPDSAGKALYMALKPIDVQPLEAALRIEPFNPTYADLVLSWVQDAREAYWLAPKTAPPLTTAHIRAWAAAAYQPLLFARAGWARPVAYGELNILSGPRRHYWLGHLILDPTWRGRGLGRAFTRLLLARSFSCCGAQAVSLVVFPENLRAIACYRAAGLYDDGYEVHVLPPYDRRVRLLRMTAEQ